MPKLEIPNIPERLLKQIEQTARQHGVTVEQEAADLLSRAIERPVVDEAALLLEVRGMRQSIKGIFVTEDELQAAKRKGRA